jgi:hypothetical protein
MDVAIPKTFEAFVRRKVEEGFNLVDDAVGVRRCAGRVERQVLSPQVGFERPCTRGSDAFDMCGDVVLTLDVPEHGVCAGDIGTALERHVVPGVSEEGYSVEFFDMAGQHRGRGHAARERPSPADGSGSAGRQLSA